MASYRAGEITYQWLYGYTYQIKYRTFTTNASMDNYCEVDSICFGDGSNGSLKRINGPCNAVCAPYCDGVGLSPSVKINEYTAQHTYVGPGSYKICFDQANRNAGIINISNSINRTISLETYLVISSFTGPNSSPVFINYPVANGCINNGCFTYSAYGTDADGDSLVYSILPYTMPGATLPGAGMSSFSINPSTGLLSWCNPGISGDYNTLIKVEEWRKNTDGSFSLVGYVHRDTQLTMENCTGIQGQQEAQEWLDIYPNPATDKITLFLQESQTLYTVELFDITGRTIKTFLKNEYAPEQLISLKLDNILQGIYFIRITTGSKTITKKIIKQ